MFSCRSFIVTGFTLYLEGRKRKFITLGLGKDFSAMIQITQSIKENI